MSNNIATIIAIINIIIYATFVAILFQCVIFSSMQKKNFLALRKWYGWQYLTRSCAVIRRCFATWIQTTNGEMLAES